MTTIAVVPAAGLGKRMGDSTRKQMLLLRGTPILDYTLDALSSCDLIDGILVMTHPDDLVCVKDERKIDELFPKLIGILAGGAERQDTVFIALEYLSRHISNPKWVVIHDGVRPFVTQDCLNETIQQAYRHSAAIAAVPVTDTIKQVDTEGKWVLDTPDRSLIWAAQTPQCFRFSLAWEAHHAARENQLSGTDDASLVERIGVKIKVVMGSYDNIKITIPVDMIIGENILAARGGKDT